MNLYEILFISILYVLSLQYDFTTIGSDFNYNIQSEWTM